MIQTIHDGFAWMESLVNLERAPNLRAYRLDRMWRLLDDFRYPQRKFHTIHVVGSKGKGSTAAFIASILHAAGLRVGCYSSPHVCDWRERFVCKPDSPPDALLVALIRQLKYYVDDNPRKPEERPTTFELLTLLAWQVFAAMECQWVIVEAGLGGRLDATNTLKPKACVITPLELEHTEYLGGTLTEVASEKLGILKPDTPLFVAAQPAEALQTIQNRARHLRAPLIYLPDEVHMVHNGQTLAENHAVEDDTPTSRLNIEIDGHSVDTTLSMIGQMQIDNAALAALTVMRCMPHLDGSVIAAGLKTMRLPGRFEYLSRRPPIIIDGAHTPNSIEAVMDAYRTLHDPHDRRRGILMFGCVDGKSHEKMAAISAPWFAQIIITRPGRFKPSKPEDIARCFARYNPNVQWIDEPEGALIMAMRIAERETCPILVAGSFYLAGAIRVAYATVNAAR